MVARTTGETDFGEALPLIHVRRLVEVRQGNHGVEGLLSGKDGPVSIVHAFGHIAANYDREALALRHANRIGRRTLDVV